MIPPIADYFKFSKRAEIYIMHKNEATKSAKYTILKIYIYKHGKQCYDKHMLNV